MKFYEQGRKKRRFRERRPHGAAGVLASPQFIFRLERSAGDGASPGRTTASPISTSRRGCRIFLWASVPDKELRRGREQGTLQTPGVLEKQVKRMLADPRSEALATRFASQWLRLQDIDKINRTRCRIRAYDHTLAKRCGARPSCSSTRSIREDRSVLDLLTADYTFVNERLARHYGIPNVAGSNFRRVQLTDPNRRGMLGHGSMLMLTSVADRTSPVLRGKWVHGSAARHRRRRRRRRTCRPRGDRRAPTKARAADGARADGSSTARIRRARRATA